MHWFSDRYETYHHDLADFARPPCNAQVMTRAVILPVFIFHSWCWMSSSFSALRLAAGPCLTCLPLLLCSACWPPCLWQTGCTWLPVPAQAIAAFLSALLPVQISDSTQPNGWIDIVCIWMVALVMQLVVHKQGQGRDKDRLLMNCSVECSDVGLLLRPV